MLDRDDLQAIAELIAASEERTSERMNGMIAASEERMTERMSGMIAASEERTSERMNGMIAASEERMKAYIHEKVTDETNRAIAYTESVVETKLDAIKEGLDLALETHIPMERIERIEENIIALKSVVRKHSEEIDLLKKAQ